jgi:hypothetical protein
MQQNNLLHYLKELMKLVLTPEEVKAILLAKVNQDFSTNFNEVTFYSYSLFRTATLEVVEPEVMEVGSAS